MSRGISFGLRTVVGVLVPLAWADLACDSAGDAEREPSGGSRAEASAGGSTSGGAESGGAESGGSSGTGGLKSSDPGGLATAGGRSSGGASGGMGGATGGADSGACGGGCKPGKTVCDEENGLCVRCLTHADCKDPMKPMCSIERECVPCQDDFSCKDTLGLKDTPVCLDGSSSLKTGEVRPNTGACAECGKSSDCGGAICDSRTLKCIPGTVYQGVSICEACTDDRECEVGMVCAPTTYFDPQDGPVGSFCLWRKDATGLVAPNGVCGLNSRPFATARIVTSANGEEVAICESLTTTCPAIQQAGTEVPGCEVEGDDEACGAAGFNDAICRKLGGGNPVCTYYCAGDDHRDCGGAMSCKNTGSEQFCGWPGIPL